MYTAGPHNMEGTAVQMAPGLAASDFLEIAGFPVMLAGPGMLDGSAALAVTLVDRERHVPY